MVQARNIIIGCKQEVIWILSIGIVNDLSKILYRRSYVKCLKI